MDQEAFETAYKQHRDQIFRYCAFRTNSYSDAEDATADVFLALIRARRPPRDHYLLPWLYRVAQRTCTNHYRRGRRVQLMPHTPEVPDTGHEPWKGHGVWNRIARLPAQQQLVIYMRVVEERPFDEIARITRRRLSATKMSFYRAMDVLRRDLSAEEEN